MAPRTPIDLDNPSWGDWLRGTIKYGEARASNAVDTPNDKYKSRQAFVDAARGKMGMLEAFDLGVRSTMDRGGLAGQAATRVLPTDAPRGEAQDKLDYAAGQLHPVPHLLGAAVGTPYAVADAIVSGRVLGEVASKVAGPAKGAWGWLTRVGERSAPAAQGPIGAWTNASTAGQRVAGTGYLPRMGQGTVAAARDFAAAHPVAAGVGAGAVALNAGMLGGNIAANIYEGKGDQFARAREEKAAAAAPTGSAGGQQTKRQPDWYDQMAALGGVDRGTIEEMVRQDGGVRISTLQALNGMRSRAPTYRDLAMAYVMDSFEQEAAQAQQSGDTARQAEIAARFQKTLAEILGADPLSIQPQAYE